MLGRKSAGVDPYWLTLAQTLVMLDGELLADHAEQLEVALRYADLADICAPVGRELLWVHGRTVSAGSANNCGSRVTDGVRA